MLPSHSRLSKFARDSEVLHVYKEKRTPPLLRTRKFDQEAKQSYAHSRASLSISDSNLKIERPAGGLAAPIVIPAKFRHPDPMSLPKGVRARPTTAACPSWVETEVTFPFLTPAMHPSTTCEPRFPLQDIPREHLRISLV